MILSACHWSRCRDFIVCSYIVCWLDEERCTHISKLKTLFLFKGLRTPDIPPLISQWGGGGVFLITTYKGRLYPKGAPFSGFRYTWLYERVGISLVEVYERVGNSVILVCNIRPKRTNRWILWLWKSSGNVLVWGLFIYLKDSALQFKGQNLPV